MDQRMYLLLEEQYASLEMTTGDVLWSECERGLMSQEQYDAILDFFARLDEHDEVSATAWLEAWCTWRDTTHPRRG